MPVDVIAYGKPKAASPCLRGLNPAQIHFPFWTGDEVGLTASRRRWIRNMLRFRKRHDSHEKRQNTSHILDQLLCSSHARFNRMNSIVRRPFVSKTAGVVVTHGMCALPEPAPWGETNS